MGYLFSIIAGATMSIQGVMNTRLSDKIGLFNSNAFVQGTAFIFSLLSLIFFKDGSFLEIKNVNKLYLLGGFLGLVITVTVMLGVKNLSPTVAISVILISQLLVASIIDKYGLMGSQVVDFTWNKYAGVFLMLCGVILFKVNFK